MHPKSDTSSSRARGAILIAAVALLPVACLAEAVEESILAESEYTEATFDYSREPQKTILFFASSGLRGGLRTIELRGDGRLVFRTLYGDEVAEEKSVDLSEDQVLRVLRQVVDYGLVEWDTTRIQARQLEKNDGRLFTAIPEDAPRDTILISLESYERGEYRAEKLERKIRFRGASAANRLYPPILEIKGISEVKRTLRQLGNQSP